MHVELVSILGKILPLPVVFAAVVATSGSVTASESLSGTWQLIEFRSMSDADGVSRPPEPATYKMTLRDDGTAQMELGCNRASGSWSATPGVRDSAGQFSFGTLAGTRALCRPPRIDDLVMRQAAYVRGYLLEGRWLHLTLMADGGVFSWQRVSEGHPATSDYQSPEDGGPRRFEVLPGVSALRLRAGTSTNSLVIGSYRGGQVLWNLGCVMVEGRAWCDVQALRGGARGYVAAEFLQAAAGPDGAVPRGIDNSALRAGQGKFDATGNLPCAWKVGQPTVQCRFGVARSSGGDATVTVIRPDGRERAIFFAHGLPLSASTSEAEGSLPFRANSEGDLHFIRVGPERYEVPDAVIVGG